MNRLTLTKRPTFPRGARGRGINGEIMAIPKNNKHKDYARYAAHCLNLVPSTKNQNDRAINREMAAEWLSLAEAIPRPLKPRK